MIEAPAEFTTPRLHLRVPRIADADAIFEEYAADPDVTRYMTWVPHREVGTVAKFLSELELRHNNGAEFSWVIAMPGEQRPFGMIGALPSEPSVLRVWAVCDTENPGSARALEKSGFERKGTLRRWMIHPNCPGGPRDCFIYGKVR